MWVEFFFRGFFFRETVSVFVNCFIFFERSFVEKCLILDILKILVKDGKSF